MLWEGWVVYYSNKDMLRKWYYWCLDCKCIMFFQNNMINRYYKEILLLEIFIVEFVQNFSFVLLGINLYCFEIVIVNVIYFVGEMFGGVLGGLSGQGVEVVWGWEIVICQVLMFVIFQDVFSVLGYVFYR